MTDNLYDALEVCLQALEQGASVESCLALFPALGDELRPVLESAVQARDGAVHDVPAQAMRRGRARVLQHAAELRERSRAGSAPLWRRPGRAGRVVRWAVTTLATVIFLLSGSTGLVFASSNSLPGDKLYPVKRSWEDVQLVLIVDPATRSQRETEFEQERVQEIHALFSESRVAQVNFQGQVQAQQPGVWQIADLRILVDQESSVDGQVAIGSLVQVIGETEDGQIKAQRIQLLAPPAAAPTSRPSSTVTAGRTPEVTEQGDGSNGGDGQTPEVTEQGDGGGQGGTPEVKNTQEPQQTESSGEKKPGKTPQPGGGGDGGGNGDGGGGGGDGGGGSGG